MAAYIRFDGVDGESVHGGHEGECAFSSFSWGVARTVFRNTGGQRETGLPEVQSISISKDYDAASPYLALACLKARNMGEVVLSFSKDAGETPVDYLTITLTNTIIESYTVGGSGNSGLVESLSLNFEQIKVLYQQDADDLTRGAEHEFTYDRLRAT